MSSYQPLADFLSSRKAARWDASFADVEAALGRPLPQSAFRHAAWWANQSGAGHSQTRGWRSVGWRTAALDLQRRRVRFERDERTSRIEGEGKNNGNALAQHAMDLTGITDHGQLMEEALGALIAREAARSLAGLGGSMPDFRSPDRERP